MDVGDGVVECGGTKFLRREVRTRRFPLAGHAHKEWDDDIRSSSLAFYGNLVFSLLLVASSRR